MDSNQEQLLWQGYYQYCNYLSQNYQNVPLPGFNKWYETIYNKNIKKIQGVYHSPEFHETTSRSVSQTNSEMSASSGKAETQSKRQRQSKSQTTVLAYSWKENFKLPESANNQRAWAKIKISVDSAGPANLFGSAKIKSEF